MVSLILTIQAFSKFDLVGGLDTIQNEDCHEMKSLSLQFHFAVSVLTTTLLNASNYYTQRLSAPTREEVNKFHAQNI